MKYTYIYTYIYVSKKKWQIRFHYSISQWSSSCTSAWWKFSLQACLAMFSTGSWKLVVNQVCCLICFPPDHFLVHGLPGCASQCECQVTRIPKWCHWWPSFALAGCSWELLCSSHGWLRSDVPGYVTALYQLCLVLLGGCFGFSWVTGPVQSVRVVSWRTLFAE